MSTSAPRTLADLLRSWSVEQLTGLLEARPDLAVPAPGDSAQLASRATTRTSLLRALDSLDTCESAVLEAVASAGPLPPAAVAALVDADTVRPALDVLRATASRQRSQVCRCASYSRRSAADSEPNTYAASQVSYRSPS